MLRDLARRSRGEGTLSALFDELGEDNICGNIDDTLNRARIYLGLPTEERPAFARPDVAREIPHGERRCRARP